jgi:sarcosine oxidase subunit beta
MQQMEKFDAIVIGGGVIGASVAYHLARLGSGPVLLLERGQIAGGTTSQSSCILRTHYSVPQNVHLAKESLAIFKNFKEYLGEEDADCGFVKCGYLAVAPDGVMGEALSKSLAQQRTFGIEAAEISRAEAKALFPIAQFDDAAVIGFEPEAGFADAYQVTTSFIRSAKRLGVVVREHTCVTGLLRQGDRVIGVSTPQGDILCDRVISAQNIWSRDLKQWTGVEFPLVMERHTVMTLNAPNNPYTNAMPVFKDFGSPGMLYFRSYGGQQMLVSEGNEGDEIESPNTEQSDVSLDYVASVGEQVAERFPGYAEAELADSWTGVYDVTPDWNPVLGKVAGVDSLIVGYGFSGHGFKLSPMVGRLLAQEALGIKTDVSLTPYALERFSSGALLKGLYGAGAVS